MPPTVGAATVGLTLSPHELMMAYEREPPRQNRRDTDAASADTAAPRAALGPADYSVQARALEPGRQTLASQQAALAPVQLDQDTAAAPTGSTAPATSDDGFSDLYKNKGQTNTGKVTVDPGRGVTYDDYRKRLGPIKASSETVGNLLPYQKKGDAAQQVMCELSEDDFFEIFDADYGAETIKSTDDDRKQLKTLFPKVNQAFRIMKLDTIGAQAAYIANAYWESAKFKFMTETEGAAGGAGYAKDPHVKLDTTYLNKAAAGKADKVGGTGTVKGYGPGGTINRGADWGKAFIGRGPLQVTHDYGYAQTLAVLETRWEELKDAKDGTQEAEDRDLCKEALDEIKQDPAQAANPKYAFLFSAAYMKRPTSNDLSSRPADQIASGGSVAGFMGKQPEKIQAKKDAVYRKAIEVLKARKESWDIAHQSGKYAPEDL